MSTDGLGWRKLQRHERTEHRLWPVLQRALRDHLLRLPDSSDGVIFQRTQRPVDDLLQALGTHSNERRAVRKALEALLSDGFLQHEAGCLWIKNFDQMQGVPGAVSSENEPKTRSAAAERKARQRQREREQSVTERDTSHVTKRDMSRVTVTGDQKRVDQTRVDRRSHTRDMSRGVTVTESHATGDVTPPDADDTSPIEVTHEPSHPEPAAAPEVTDDRETPIPMDFKTRFPSSAIDELATGYGVPRSAVEAELHEFATYWTIGAGAGKRRRNWAAQFRRRVQTRAQAGELGSQPQSRPRDVRQQQPYDPSINPVLKWAREYNGHIVKRDAEGNPLPDQDFTT